MKKILINELIDSRRLLLIHTGIFSGIIFIWILGCRIFEIDMYNLYIGLGTMPSALKTTVSFLYRGTISNPVRSFLLMEMLVNIPVLFYAALLPAHVIGEENENGTMTMICNAPFSRKKIFYGKIIVCLLNYAITVAVMFLLTFVLTISSDGFANSLQACVRVYAFLLIMGIFLIHLTSFYCSIKSAYTPSADNVTLWMCFDTFLGYLYIIIKLAENILEMSGKSAALDDTVSNVFYWIGRLSVVQLCNPADVYINFPWILSIILVISSVVLGLAAGKLYERKEFGIE